MKHLQPVIWSKGTFLTPQHLQVQDRFIEDCLHFQLTALRYCAWGFSELRIDHEKLADGDFAISSASGIFPDGLLFDIPRCDAAPSSRSLLNLFDSKTNELDVFLTVPNYRDNGANVALGEHRNGNARYLAEVASFRDENTGESEKPVHLARKNFRFLVAGEHRQGTSGLHVAQVERTGAGIFRLCPAFVPPLINFAASEYISGIVREVVETLAGRSEQLCGTRRQKNENLVDFTSVDIANFWLLYTINSHLPVFHHLFGRKSGHPEALYSAMASLAGALTTFSTKIRPQGFALYDHEALGPCFSNLAEQLRILLNTVVPTNLVSLQLTRTRPSIYNTALTDDRYLVNAQMYLAFSADNTEDEIIRRVPQLIKICSATHIDHLVKQALPGIQLRHLQTPPSAIPVKLNRQYFALNQSGAAWEAIRRSRNLAAYVPSDFPNPQMELIIVLPAAV